MFKITRMHNNVIHLRTLCSSFALILFYNETFERSWSHNKLLSFLFQLLESEINVYIFYKYVLYVQKYYEH